MTGARDIAGGRTAHDIAAGWLLREEAGPLSGAERGRLDAWIVADPAHAQAWAEVRRALATVADNAADPELMAMRASALAARGEGGRGAWRIAAVLAGIAVLAGAGWLATGPLDVSRSSLPGPAQVTQTNPDTALYRTAVGERSAITLPDGSVATLDTNSVLQVAYTSAERGVRLVSGQALFEVAKHRPTPFQVYAGGRRITAVGTRFNVRLDGAGAAAKVSVALLEGVVKVSAAPLPLPHAARGAPVESVTMAAGEVLEASPTAPVRVAAGDTERVASWRAGVLTFNDAPLGQAVGEMNRYTTRHISLADPTLASLRVSGVFRTGDPERFAETVAEVFPVRVDHDAAGATVIRPRG